MIDFQQGISFHKNIAHVSNPNFNICKKTVFDNLLQYTTCYANNENCIWFGNNGVMWHTLYDIKNGFKELIINGEKYLIHLPELLVHIGKNMRAEYIIDIYLKDIYDIENVKSCFLKVDGSLFKIEKSNYVEESSSIIDHIFKDYNFCCDEILLQKILSDHNEIIENSSDIDTKLSTMVNNWKNEIYFNIGDFHIMNTLINQNNKYIPINQNKNKFFMGIYFEVMKNIKMGSKRYVVYDIQCCDTIDESIKTRFINDKILLVDIENQKKVVLPLYKIIDSKFKSHSSKNSIIINKSIKVGNYLNYMGDQTAHKITKMELDKDKYSMKIFFNERKFGIEKVGEVKEGSFDYNLIEQPTDVNASDIYDIVGISDRNVKYPSFIVKNSIIVTDKKSNERHTFDELIDYVGNGYYYNKLNGEIIKENYMKIKNKDTFLNMLKRISYDDNESNGKNRNIDRYSYGYIPDENCCVNRLIKQTDDIFIDTLNAFIHVKSDGMIGNNDININKFVVKSVKLPCIINNLELRNDIVYISHHKDFFNRRIKLHSIETNDYNILCIFYTIDDMETHTVSLYTIDQWSFCADEQIEIEGLSIGQYGKLNRLGASQGFKKSLWHGIKDFYKRTVDGQKMVLFENNIAVSVDLIDIEYFNETSIKVRNINQEFLSKNDLINIANSKKNLRHSIYLANYMVKCELV